VDQDLLQVEKSCVVVSKEFVASFAKSFSILLLFCARQFGYLTRFIYFSFDYVHTRVSSCGPPAWAAAGACRQRNALPCVIFYSDRK
jgi:hypothetical protein